MGDTGRRAVVLPKQYSQKGLAQGPEFKTQCRQRGKNNFLATTHIKECPWYFLFYD
jgi:hypothetical protein